MVGELLALRDEVDELAGASSTGEGDAAVLRFLTVVLSSSSVEARLRARRRVRASVTVELKRNGRAKDALEALDVARAGDDDLERLLLDVLALRLALLGRRDVLELVSRAPAG